MVNRTDSGLSITSQAGKAAEHIACAELIMQGWNAFMVDAGLPYDVVVEIAPGHFCRVQVKATHTPMKPRAKKERNAVQPRYRFALRKSRTGQRRIDLSGCDHLAFVALDIRVVSFLPVSAVIMADGRAACEIEFKTRGFKYIRLGKTGTDPSKGGRFLEDFIKFNPFAAGG